MTVVENAKIRNFDLHRALLTRLNISGSEEMPVILWLLGVPLSLVLVLLLVGVI